MSSQNYVCYFTGDLTNDFFSSMQSSTCVLETPLLFDHSRNYNMLMNLSSFANQIVTCFFFSFTISADDFSMQHKFLFLLSRHMTL